MTADPLTQASALAGQLLAGLIGPEPLPARWLDGTPRLESPAAADWFTPLGLADSEPETLEHDCAA